MKYQTPSQNTGPIPQHEASEGGVILAAEILRQRIDILEKSFYQLVDQLDPVLLPLQTANEATEPPPGCNAGSKLGMEIMESVDRLNKIVQSIYDVHRRVDV